jgi:DNA-binding NtrC family response regulator
LRIADPTISARHLSVQITSQGVQLEDLDSTNGMFIGATRVRVALVSEPDTRLGVGRTTLTLRRAGKKLPGCEVLVPGLVGNSPLMRQLANDIVRYAPLSAPVLIEGESGTGKDLVARALHQLSARQGAYVPLNCSSLLEGLADSELFGHCKGAFTGAVAQRTGAFVQADKGTLFLDEIAELAPSVQARLLRVIEDGQVRPVGATGVTRVETRLVTATWKSLPQAAENGEFRADLLHRIGMVVLRVPPLRKRKGDIAGLAAVLLRRMAKDVGEKVLTQGALEQLRQHDWPGNVRELRSVLYRAALCSEGAEIALQHVREVAPEASNRRAVGMTSDQAWRLLNASGGNVSRAARQAKVARSTFRSWMARVDNDSADS